MCSQFKPVVCPEHLQTYEPCVFKQLPPFLQGDNVNQTSINIKIAMSTFKSIVTITVICVL